MKRRNDMEEFLQLFFICAIAYLIGWCFRKEDE